jgi:hypothetical protein
VPCLLCECGRERKGNNVKKDRRGEWKGKAKEEETGKNSLRLIKV